jgi:hypothetical protein
LSISEAALTEIAGASLLRMCACVKKIFEEVEMKKNVTFPTHFTQKPKPIL